jgi:hypothetical protein
MLAKAAAGTAISGDADTLKSGQSENWLAFLDTYRTMCISPLPEFRRVLEAVRALSMVLTW